MQKHAIARPFRPLSLDSGLAERYRTGDMRSITRWRPQPTTGATATRGGARQPAPRALGIPDAEWHALTTLRPNLLLEGKLTATDPALRALRRHLVEPLRCWRATTQLTLPQDHHHGSLLLLAVASSSAEDQARLCEWLHQGPKHVQVISTSTQPLFAAVERGNFLADLYYRLAIVRLTVT